MIGILVEHRRFMSEWTCADCGHHVELHRRTPTGSYVCHDCDGHCVEERWS